MVQTFALETVSKSELGHLIIKMSRGGVAHVPWRDWDEWMFVYKSLFDQNPVIQMEVWFYVVLLIVSGRAVYKCMAFEMSTSTIRRLDWPASNVAITRTR